MGHLEVTFLGTGTSQGVPTVACECSVCQSVDYRDKRFRSSILIKSKDKQILVDTGPDFRSQMLTNHVKHLEAVLFTHAHRDHTAGFDDLRAFYFKLGRDFPVYAEKMVWDSLREMFGYIFSEYRYPGVLTVEENVINSKDNFQIAGIEITPIRVLHYKLPVLGFRFGKFAYITDASSIPEEEWEKLEGLDVLVVNGLQREPHISHFTFDEAIEVILKSKAKKGYLTHISHKLGKHAEVEKELPDHIRLAYDGLTIHAAS